MSGGSVQDSRGGPLAVLRIASPIAAVICLGGGLAFAGHLLATAAVLLAGAAMLLTLRRPRAWLATAALAALAALAAYGMLASASPYLMLPGAAASLAGWDLALAGIRHPNGAPRDALLERRRLRALGLALGAGVAAAAIGINLNLTLPFIVVLLLVALGVWALDRVLKSAR